MVFTNLFLESEKLKVTKNGFGGEETEEITVKEHDLRQINKLNQGTLLSIAMISFLHFQMKFTHPMFLQIVLPWKNLTGNIFKIHLFGSEATGKLQRPWVEKNPFAGLTASEPTAEPAETEAVPKKSKSRKEE